MKTGDYNQSRLTCPGGQYQPHLDLVVQISLRTIILLCAQIMALARIMHNFHEHRRCQQRARCGCKPRIECAEDVIESVGYHITCIHRRRVGNMLYMETLDYYVELVFSWISFITRPKDGEKQRAFWFVFLFFVPLPRTLGVMAPHLLCWWMYDIYFQVWQPLCCHLKAYYKQACTVQWISNTKVSPWLISAFVSDSACKMWSTKPSGNIFRAVRSTSKKTAHLSYIFVLCTIPFIAIQKCTNCLLVTFTHIGVPI